MRPSATVLVSPASALRGAPDEHLLGCIRLHPWLLELGTPACVELVPLFRHHGVDGAVLMMLDGTELAEVGVPRLTSLVLLRARDKLLSSL